MSGIIIMPGLTQPIQTTVAIILTWKRGGGGGGGGRGGEGRKENITLWQWGPRGSVSISLHFYGEALSKKVIIENISYR